MPEAVRTFLRSGLLLWLTACAVVAADNKNVYTGWLKLSTPEFVVVTPLREKEAVAWAGEFAQYVAALRSYFKAEQRRLPPLTFVVFARERDFEAYRPLGADGKPEQVAAFFIRHEAWAVAGTGGSTLEKQMRHTIFHEGVHWFMSTAETPNPIWLEEGMAEVFATFEVNQGRAEWGKSIENHVRLLRSQGLMPLERLLYTGREELFGDDARHTSKVYAESWAFAHYLIFGLHKIPPTAMAEYAKFSLGDLGPDEAFRRAFGKTYREMDDELARYIKSGNYYLNKMPLASFAAPRVEDASRLDVEDALGRLALGAHRWERAATHARIAIGRAEHDPRGHEVLGLALKELGDRPGAIAEFALAEKNGTKDAQVYFELAVAEQNDGASAVGTVLPLGPSDARRVANRYERAISLHPRFMAAYRNLSGVIGVAQPFGAEDRKFLEYGKKIWPTDAAIEVGLAVLTRREGDSATARAQLNRVLTAPAGTGDAAPARAYARRLLEGWEQEDLFATVNRLVAEHKFAEAIAFTEESLQRGVPSTVQPQIVGMQASLRESLAGQKIQEALKEMHWAEARRLLLELLAGEGSAGMKTQARRTLADLDRQGLGLEPAAK